MTTLFGKVAKQILPAKHSTTIAGLSVLNSLEKMAIVEEADKLGNRKARNWDSLDLSNSIYTEDEE